MSLNNSNSVNRPASPHRTRPCASSPRATDTTTDTGPSASGRFRVPGRHLPPSPPRPPSAPRPTIAQVLAREWAQLVAGPGKTPTLGDRVTALELRLHNLERDLSDLELHVPDGPELPFSSSRLAETIKRRAREAALARVRELQKGTP